MDPEVCYEQILKAFDDKDPVLAIENMRIMTEWLNSGGFMPELCENPKQPLFVMDGEICSKGKIIERNVGDQTIEPYLDSLEIGDGFRIKKNGGIGCGGTVFRISRKGVK